MNKMIKQIRRYRAQPPFRRRANALLFVVFLLGALFTSTMAFLALMRLNRDVVRRGESRIGIDSFIADTVDSFLVVSEQSILGLAFPYVAGSGVQDPCNPGGAKPIAVPYAQLVVDCDDDGMADNPALLSQWAEIAGPHYLPSSLEPHRTGVGAAENDLEYFAVTDFFRLTIGRHGYRVFDDGLVSNYHPALPATRPLRVRALGGDAGYAPDNYDEFAQEHHGFRRDARGDGAVDALTVALSIPTEGEPELYPSGVAPEGDGSPLPSADADCDTRLINDWTNLSGFPSFTDPDPAAAPLLTPLPCDDQLPLGAVDDILQRGSAYPPLVRIPIAEIVTPQGVSSDEVYLVLRVEQNSGRVNLAASHPTLVNNLFGLDSDDLLLAGKMANRDKYEPVSHEPWLRHRGILVGPSVPDTFGLGLDIANAPGLSRMLFEHLRNTASGLPQLAPIADEPGDGQTFDTDWANRWMDADRWMDPQTADAAGANIDYDVRHLCTVASYDDLLMRNGFYQPDPAGARVLLTDLTGLGPAYPQLGSPIAAGQTALGTYPGYDDSCLTGGDCSFFDTLSGTAKVPLTLARDASNELIAGQNLRFGKMMFALHSVGNIDSPTQREVATVRDYFTAMLRNVKNWGAWGPGVIDPPTLDNAIHDQAAKLAANFFDFADTNNTPTLVLSRSDPNGGVIFAGVERQPLISEAWFDGTDGAVELFYPHGADTSPEQLILGTPQQEYGLRVIDDLNGVVPPGFTPFANTDVIGPAAGLGSRYLFFSNNPSALPAINRSDTQMLDLAGIGQNDRVQLVQKLSSGGSDFYVVVDEVFIEIAATPSQQRDTTTAGGWIATVPVYAQSGSDQTLGLPNDVTGLQVTGLPVLPVYATSDNLGLAAAYPTTGSLLLLMRPANGVLTAAELDSNASTKPMTFALGPDPAGGGDPTLFENGRMPVFDQNQVAQRDWNLGHPAVPNFVPGAQPLDGSTLLNVPWGQLIFDYFTALPLVDHDFDPTQAPQFIDPRILGPGDPAFASYVRQNQPTVEWGGLRVHGRINVNAAPWKVLEGLPYFPPKALPIYRDLFYDLSSPGVADTWIGNPAYGEMGTASILFTADGNAPANPVEVLGWEKASAIVAYRELREVVDPVAAAWTTGNYNALNGGNRWRKDSSTVGLGPATVASTSQRHTAGFLAVGELANVRFATDPDFGNQTPAPTSGLFEMDNGQNAAGGDYLRAIAPLVALGDWVTVKSNVNVLYGVVRGAGDEVEADELAWRFEAAYDRTNTLVSNDPKELPTLLYPTVVEPYLP